MRIRLGNVRALAFLLSGLGFLAVGIVVMNSATSHLDWLQQHGTLAQARVLTVQCNGEYRSLCAAHDSVRFTDRDGRPVIATIYLPDLSPLRPGDYVPVKYDPNKPTDVQTVKSPDAGYRGIIAATLWIVAFSLLAVAVGVAFRKRGDASADRHLEAHSRLPIR